MTMIVRVVYEHASGWQLLLTDTALGGVVRLVVDREGGYEADVVAKRVVMDSSNPLVVPLRLDLL